MLFLLTSRLGNVWNLNDICPKNVFKRVEVGGEIRQSMGKKKFSVANIFPSFKYYLIYKERIYIAEELFISFWTIPIFDVCWLSVLINSKY